VSNVQVPRELLERISDYIAQGPWQPDQEALAPLIAALLSQPEPVEDPVAIDWRRVPAPFDYFAADEDGDMLFYVMEPIQSKGMWVCDAPDTRFMRAPALSVTMANRYDWKRSFRKRPETPCPSSAP
jgi:hypothetical protein